MTITQIAIRYPSTAIDPKIGTEAPAPGYTIAIRPLHAPAKDLAQAVKKIAIALAHGENPAAIARDFAGMTTASRLDARRGIYIEITDDRKIRAALTEIPKVAKNERYIACPKNAHAFSDDMAEIWDLFPMCAPRVTNALKKDAKERANLGINPVPSTRQKKLTAAAAECLATPAEWLKNDPMDSAPAPVIEHEPAPAATKRPRRGRRRVTRPAGAPNRGAAVIAAPPAAVDPVTHIARRGRRRRVTRAFNRAAA